MIKTHVFLKIILCLLGLSSAFAGESFSPGPLPINREIKTVPLQQYIEHTPAFFVYPLEDSFPAIRSLFDDKDVPFFIENQTTLDFERPIPHEIMKYIVSFCQYQDIANLAFSSKYWYKTLSGYLTAVKKQAILEVPLSKTLTCFDTLKNKVFPYKGLFIYESPKIKNIQFRFPDNIDFSAVTFLDVTLSTIEPELINQITDLFPNLTALKLDSISLNDACLRELEKLSGLRVLSLGIYAYDKEGPPGIVDYRDSLLIRKAPLPDFTDEGVALLLPHLPRLQFLDFCNAVHIGSLTCRALHDYLPNLAYFKAEDCMIRPLVELYWWLNGSEKLIYVSTIHSLALLGFQDPDLERTVDVLYLLDHLSFTEPKPYHYQWDKENDIINDFFQYSLNKSRKSKMISLPDRSSRPSSK